LSTTDLPMDMAGHSDDSADASDLLRPSVWHTSLPAVQSALQYINN